MVKRVIDLTFEEIDVLIKMIDGIECNNHQQTFVKQQVRSKLVYSL